MKSIIDDPYEEWSAGLDFKWIDETEDLAVENMVRLIGEGFVFKKEMFKGGINALDLSRLRGEKKLKEKETEKKLKEKEPKDKNVKDHAAEPSECEGSSEYHDMILSLEKRIYQALDAKLERLVPTASQSQPAGIIQSTISQCLKDLDKKICDSIGRQLKDMQAAIIKGVIDTIGDPRSSCDVLSGEPTNDRPATVTEPTEPPVYVFTSPSEAADSRINDVLRDLNVFANNSLPATTQVGPAPLQRPNADVSAHIDEVST